MTQKTKSARRALRIDADHLFIGLIVLFVLTLAYIEYDKHQRTQAAAEVARNGEGEVLKLFRAWKFDQLQGDKVMLWSGENAEVLWVGVWTPDDGRDADPFLASWTIYARSQSAEPRYFSAKYHISKETLSMQPSRGDQFSTLTREQIISSAARDGRKDVLVKLGVTFEPA